MFRDEDGGDSSSDSGAGAGTGTRAKPKTKVSAKRLPVSSNAGWRERSASVNSSSSSSNRDDTANRRSSQLDHNPSGAFRPVVQLPGLQTTTAPAAPSPSSLLGQKRTLHAAELAHDYEGQDSPRSSKRGRSSDLQSISRESSTIEGTLAMSPSAKPSKHDLVSKMGALATRSLTRTPELFDYEHRSGASPSNSQSSMTSMSRGPRTLPLSIATPRATHGFSSGVLEGKGNVAGTVRRIDRHARNWNGDIVATLYYPETLQSSSSAPPPSDQELVRHLYDERSRARIMGRCRPSESSVIQRFLAGRDGSRLGDAFVLYGRPGSGKMDLVRWACAQEDVLLVRIHDTRIATPAGNGPTSSSAFPNLQQHPPREIEPCFLRGSGGVQRAGADTAAPECHCTTCAIHALLETAVREAPAGRLSVACSNCDALVEMCTTGVVIPEWLGIYRAILPLIYPEMSDMAPAMRIIFCMGVAPPYPFYFAGQMCSGSAQAFMQRTLSWQRALWLAPIGVRTASGADGERPNDTARSPRSSSDGGRWLVGACVEAALAAQQVPVKPSDEEIDVVSEYLQYCLVDELSNMVEGAVMAWLHHYRNAAEESLNAPHPLADIYGEDTVNSSAGEVYDPENPSMYPARDIRDADVDVDDDDDDDRDVLLRVIRAGGTMAGGMQAAGIAETTGAGAPSAESAQGEDMLDRRLSSLVTRESATSRIHRTMMAMPPPMSFASVVLSLIDESSRRLQGNASKFSPGSYARVVIGNVAASPYAIIQTTPGSRHSISTLYSGSVFTSPDSPSTKTYQSCYFVARNITDYAERATRSLGESLVYTINPGTPIKAQLKASKIMDRLHPDLAGAAAAAAAEYSSAMRGAKHRRKIAENRRIATADAVYRPESPCYASSSAYI